jgi:carbamoyltransferase
MPAPVMSMKGITAADVDMAYVTHWSPSGVLASMSHKHWMPELLDGVPIRTLTPDCTHHDTHMAAAMCYAGSDFPYGSGTYGLVIDGFGTMGEHLSVYYLSDGHVMLRKRVHGYDTSLGLWYQYATAFMGMKMHEDEYKLLGYEVHVPNDVADKLDLLAEERALLWIEQMEQSVYTSKYDPVYSVDALPKVRERIFKELHEICQKIDITDSNSFESRAKLAYYVQAVLERVVLKVLEPFGQPENLICSGGVFYNVKLNKRLVDLVHNRICIYPLAGDQGNAIGLYSMDHPNFKFPHNLNWGLRALESKGDVQGLHVMSENDALDFVIRSLKSVGYVNLVRGAMEFGPRAMCNTSTLAVPTRENVDRINAANNRNTVMPMAPVMTASMYRWLFKNHHKLWRSQHHMITALEYDVTVGPEGDGIAHRYPRSGIATGRPQVIDPDDRFMYVVLGEMGSPLINTSFNFHGKPIAFDMPSVIDNHMMQYQRDQSFQTVVVKNV